jgi:hypothetical protein
VVLLVTVFASLALMLAAVVAAAAVVARLVPADAPTVTRNAALTVRDVERALRLAGVHDPQRAIPGVVRTLSLSAHEAELLIDQAAARVRPGHWQLALGADQARLRGSVRLPDNPLGPWLNVELQLRRAHGLPELEAVQLGRLSLPPALVTAALQALARHYGLADVDGMAPLLDVQQVRWTARRLDVVYAWGADAPQRILTALLPPQDRERLHLYAERLIDVHRALPAGTPAALSQLMPPLFELARQRSAQGGDAAAENRAVLLVLGMAANGTGLAALLPDRRAELRARPIRVTLAGRSDSPQHYLVSATLAADAGSPLAGLIGLYKEIADSRGGSGFSFNDMAANRAGMRLGELAVGEPERLQLLLSRELREQDLLPDVSDLPEGMPEREFRSRFGGPGSPAYERMLSDIEERVEATPLYR